MGYTRIKEMSQENKCCDTCRFKRFKERPITYKSAVKFDTICTKTFKSIYDSQSMCCDDYKQRKG